jgi:3-oxoadipate enol-lactonase
VLVCVKGQSKGTTVPFATISESQMIPGVSPVKIHYREVGDGTPLIFLHSGWGYCTYPFNHQIEAFNSRFKIIIPDRSGYGGSMKIESLPADFHVRAATEMISLLDALNIQHGVLWGHSDGAVIAAWMGLLDPARFSGLILEAFHYFKVKPRSEGFFKSLSHNPEQVGERICRRLILDHGEDHWRKVIKNNCEAWLRIAMESKHPSEDLYGGKLQWLTVPTIFIHGIHDPRTEPSEIETVCQVLPRASINRIEGARHSPHSEEGVMHHTNELAKCFLQSISSEISWRSY